MLEEVLILTIIGLALILFSKNKKIKFLERELELEQQKVYYMGRFEDLKNNRISGLTLQNNHLAIENEILKGN